MKEIMIETQHQRHDSVSHCFFDGSSPFATLEFGHPHGHTVVYFRTAEQVDAVAAELAEIRALLAGPSPEPGPSVNGAARAAVTR